MHLFWFSIWSSNRQMSLQPPKVLGKIKNKSFNGFQVSGTSNFLLLLVFFVCLEQYSVQLQQCDGCPVNWLCREGQALPSGLSAGVTGRVPVGGSWAVTCYVGEAETVLTSQALQLQEPTSGDSYAQQSHPTHTEITKNPLCLLCPGWEAWE